MRRLDVRRTAHGAAATAALLLSAAVLAPAAAADEGGWGGVDDGGGDYRANAGTVTIIDGTTGDDGGSDPGSGTYTRPAPHYCGYRNFEISPEDFEEGGMAGWYAPFTAERGYAPDGRPADLEQRQDADEGSYWVAGCGVDYASDDWPFDFERTGAYSDEYFAQNGIWWVDPGRDIPAAPDTPAWVLLDLAEDEVSVPDPVVDINPVGASVVNLPTWVWVDPSTYEPMTVRAESGANWAEIVVEPSGVSLSAPNGEQVGSCASGGTPYDTSSSPGAQDTDCAIVFTRSSASAAGGAWSLTVETTWTASYTTSDGESGQLDGAAAATVIDVAVAEVQTKVNGL